MTTAKTILDWNNYDEEFQDNIGSHAFTLDVNDDGSVTASEVIGMEDHVETYEDADAAIEYIRDNWYSPEGETFPGDHDLRGLALEALRQYVEEKNEAFFTGGSLSLEDFEKLADKIGEIVK